VVLGWLHRSRLGHLTLVPWLDRGRESRRGGQKWEKKESRRREKKEEKENRERKKKITEE
jgi:hypothetical protein